MRKSIKAIVCTVSALVICAAPTVTPFSEITVNTAITAGAADRIETSDHKWEFYITNGTAEIYKYKGTGSNVTIPTSLTDPATKKSYKVSSIMQYSFSKNTYIKSVTVPKGITEIPIGAFSDATNLTQINLPNGLKKICTSAFMNTKLSKITFPSTLEVIQENAFQDTQLTTITFGKNVKEIGRMAFSGTKITSLTIPSNVKKIDGMAFSNCGSLKNATFDGYFKAGGSLFSGCNCLENVNMDIGSFSAVFSSGALGGAPNLKKINNTKVVNLDYNGKPYFVYPYQPYLTLYFAINDSSDVSFMND